MRDSSLVRLTGRCPGGSLVAALGLCRGAYCPPCAGFGAWLFGYQTPLLLALVALGRTLLDFGLGLRQCARAVFACLVMRRPATSCVLPVKLPQIQLLDHRYHKVRQVVRR